MLAQQRAFASQAASTSARGPAFSRGQLSVVARESRIGGKPIPVPKGTTITIDGLTVKAKVRILLQADGWMWLPSFPIHRRASG